MLLQAIMGTDVVQLESRLVEEDLLLCNIKRGDRGRGEKGSKNSALGAPGSFWHHLCLQLIGLGAGLEGSQGQPRVWKGVCRAECPCGAHASPPCSLGIYQVLHH